MKPPIFTYQKPADLKECLAILSQVEGEVRVLAGGQSLMPMLNFRLAKPWVLVDINALTALDFIEQDDGQLKIGALTRHHSLLENKLVKQFAPLIAGAAEFIGHPAIRNRGTIGGSVSHADPSAELPVVLTALKAEIVLQSRDGKRVLKTQDYFRGPLVTARKPHELLTEIIVPVKDERSGWGFHEVARRHGDFALVAAAACLTMDSKRRVKDVALALGGIADRPLRSEVCEAALKGKEATAEVLRQACLHVSTGIDANADIHASADYRRHLARVLAFRALSDAVRRAGEG